MSASVEATGLPLRKVNLYRTHPILACGILGAGVFNVGLCLNFWFSHPTFSPFGVNKFIVAVVFGWLGLSQLVYLNVFRDLKLVRASLAFAIWFSVLWSVGNSQQWWHHKSSLQLPIYVVWSAFTQLLLLIEAPVNPATRRK